MRIRSFGLLQLGPLPLGAFAEPQYEELTNAPSKERMRMFAAGPATNIFAAVVCLIFLGGLAGQFVASESEFTLEELCKMRVQTLLVYNLGIPSSLLTKHR